MLEERREAGFLSEDSKTGRMTMGSLISGSVAYLISSSIFGEKKKNLGLGLLYMVYYFTWHLTLKVNTL